jgi:hypothetical protein
MKQLSFSTPLSFSTEVPSGVPPAVADILHAAQSMVFSARIVRGCWGVGIGPKRKWILTGDCCCALGALLVIRGAVAEPHETSPRATILRVLGLTGDELDSFVHGFDDHGRMYDDLEWFRYGEMVAKKVVIHDAA